VEPLLQGLLRFAIMARRKRCFSSNGAQRTFWYVSTGSAENRRLQTAWREHRKTRSHWEDNSMWYLISELWLFLLIAVLVGFYVGWST
jgi:hypothetical protein